MIIAGMYTDEEGPLYMETAIAALELGKQVRMVSRDNNDVQTGEVIIEAVCGAYEVKQNSGALQPHTITQSSNPIEALQRAQQTLNGEREHRIHSLLSCHREEKPENLSSKDWWARKKVHNDEMMSALDVYSRVRREAEAGNEQAQKFLCGLQ